MKFKNGFTLAEVLITIGIIGFIASLTIPVMMNSMPSSNKIVYRKIYSSLQGSLSNMYDDELNYPMDEVNKTLALQRGFDYTDHTVNSIGGTYYNKFCYLLTNKLSVQGNVANILDSQTGYCTFSTIDGAYWKIYIPVSDTTSWANYDTAAAANAGNSQFPLERNTYATKILIDVNGTSNKPNCSQDTNANAYGFNYSANCSDADQFILGVRFDGKLQIGSANGADANAVEILTNIHDLKR